MGMNAYMGMDAYTFMPIIGIYAYRHSNMGIFKGINAHIGINPYMVIHACIDIYAYIGKMPKGINDMPIQ